MRRFLAGLLTGLVSLGVVGVSATAASATSTPSASLTSLTADPTANTGAFSVPVTGIPGQAFHPQNASDSGPVQSIGVGHIGVGHIGVGHIGVGHIGVGHIGVGHIGVGHIGLVDATLNGVLLSDLPISYPHGCADPSSTTPCTGWSAVLAGTGLEFAPTQNVTLLQVLQNTTARTRFETLDLSDLDLTHTAREPAVRGN